ncbi:MAG: beta-galactosidase [Rhizobiales bacterium]|nr:beta-galactosidase [Hyphomicrobiales bacterium]
MKLGVCYYPEHWPETWWQDDARAMVAMGLSWVRIGEFAWSRMEPEPGHFNWAWLDRAIDTLGDAGLQIVMGTPTATPPKWLVDQHPDMIAIDENGRPRLFGSRRHYCFSSESYRAECLRIVTALAERYGQHPAIGAWQTDNEFGCHNTTISYSEAAATRFRQWLARRYNDVDSLNRAWGSVFWSMEYRSFDEIDPPHLTVTEVNPSHRLDYNRFASNEVVSFNKLQVDVLRRLSPGRDITHNFMGFYTEFDHFDVGRDLDVATWDSYPLGFLEQFWFSPEEKQRYLRQGHPDVAGFHHDLYRGCGQGRWWVMEQQPGPVNWARYNPAPLPGMVRAWTWEAFAHGAEVVSYFRWRQAPFAQEQMHAGLNLPDRSLDIGGQEARQVADEIEILGPIATTEQAKVALIFSYEADWMSLIQPQGRSFRWLHMAFETYSALRGMGLDVDMVPPGADLTAYKLVIAPAQIHVSNELVEAISKSEAVLLLGPRSGSKTKDFQIPDTLPPGPVQQLLPIKVTRVESLRPGTLSDVIYKSRDLKGHMWREDIRSQLIPHATYKNGEGAWYQQGRVNYLGFWPDREALAHILCELAEDAGLEVQSLPEDVRISRRGGFVFAINYAADTRSAPAPEDADFLVGGHEMLPAGVSIWRDVTA